jgi:hypothetical protein
MMASHIDGSLAFLKTELKITDAQLPLWDAFARMRRRHLPVATISTCGLLHREQTSRSRQSSTDVSAPYRVAISGGSGSTWCQQDLHFSSPERGAELPEVITACNRGCTTAMVQDVVR